MSEMWRGYRTGEQRPGSTGSKLRGMGRKVNRDGSLGAS